MTEAICTPLFGKFLSILAPVDWRPEMPSSGSGGVHAVSRLSIHVVVLVLLTGGGRLASGEAPGFEATEPIVFSKASCAVKSDFLQYRSFADPLIEVLLPTAYDRSKR